MILLCSRTLSLRFIYWCLVYDLSGFYLYFPVFLLYTSRHKHGGDKQGLSYASLFLYFILCCTFFCFFFTNLLFYLYISWFNRHTKKGQSYNLFIHSGTRCPHLVHFYLSFFVGILAGLYLAFFDDRNIITLEGGSSNNTHSFANLT
jgi:hypothetical protein